MAGDTVRDVRSGYFHVGEAATPVALAAWLRNNSRNTNGNIQISGQGSTYGGVRIRAGAATVTVIVYDATADGDMTPQNVVDTCVTTLWDGSNIPVQVARGIRISIAGADANTDVTIYYRTD